MKKLTYLLVFALFVCTVAACSGETAVSPTTAPTAIPSPPTTIPSNTENMIQPGDMIGEMEFVIAEKWHWDNNLYSLCEKVGERIEITEHVIEINCEMPAGSQMIFNCAGVQADSTEELDIE